MNSLWDIYRRVVTVLVKALALCSGIGVLVMMAVTCGDIIGRKFGHSITGAVDIVQVAAHCPTQPPSRDTVPSKYSRRSFRAQYAQFWMGYGASR